MTLTNRVNVRFITSKAKNYKRVILYIHNPPGPSFPTVRNERDKGSRLWFEIPDTSFLGSGMTSKNQFNITTVS
ncbi:hypothetical protein ACNO7T_16065 [Vibrio campbellii]